MATKQKMMTDQQAAALSALADAFLPDELRPKRRARRKLLRRLGGLGVVALAGAAVYLFLRRAGE